MAAQDKMDIAFDIFNERNAILASYSITRTKEEQDMFGRMIEIIQTPDSICGKGSKEMSFDNISSLNLFQDDDMNQLLKIILQRMDSQSSQVGFTDNLFHIFFSREKAKTMTASMMTENKMFMKIWKTRNNDLSIKEQNVKLANDLHTWKASNLEIRKPIVSCLENQSISRDL